jgi:succinoglycan biosynthesis transport protein ExoP
MENNIHHSIVPASQLPQAFYVADDNMDEKYLHLTDYGNILIKRKWWVLGFLLSMIITVGLYTFTRTPIYRASAMLQIVQDSPQALIGDRSDPLMAFQYDTQNRFYETQYKLLNSRPIAEKIIDSLKLQEHPEFKVSEEEKRNISPERIKAIQAGRLAGNMEVNPIKNTYLVEVAYKSSDKELAQQITNATYKEYLRFSMETRQQSYTLIREWLQNELVQLANKVETSQRKVFEHGQKKDFLALEGEDNVIVKKFVELNRLLTTAQSERMVKEAQYQQVKEKGTDAPIVINNPLIVKLREDIIGQEAKVSGIKRIFGKNYPQLQAEMANLAELRSRLNNEWKRIQTSIKADYEVALRTENFLREEFEKQKSKVGNLQSNLVQHYILKRDLQTNEQLYQGLLARMKEANVASTMVPSNAAVIERAELPQAPFNPRKFRNMSLAAFLGLMGGIGLAFVVEYFDKSIKTTEDLERLYRIPALGVVPFLSQNGQMPEKESFLGLETFDNPKSLIAEATYHVSTAVMLSLAERPPAAIMITSPNPMEGKSTLSINLASSLAMSGRRLVLLDADLRKPIIHKIFKQPGQPGLSNFLTGSASMSEILRSTKVPNLFFIPAGAIPPNPIQLLNSPAFLELVKNLRQEFQHIIFDTPPIIGFADGRAISSLADGVLLIFKHHYTSREAGRLALQLLSQVNAQVLGAVLNMVRREKLGYGGYYAYFKYYSKYYSSYQKIGKIDSE